MRTNTRKWK